MEQTRAVLYYNQPDGCGEGFGYITDLIRSSQLIVTFTSMQLQAAQPVSSCCTADKWT